MKKTKLKPNELQLLNTKKTIINTDFKYLIIKLILFLPCIYLCLFLFKVELINSFYLLISTLLIFFIISALLWVPFQQKVNNINLDISTNIQIPTVLTISKITLHLNQFKTYDSSPSNKLIGWSNVVYRVEFDKYKFYCREKDAIKLEIGSKITANICPSSSFVLSLSHNEKDLIVGLHKTGQKEIL